MTTPVSLPLTSTLPPVGTTVLPSSLLPALQSIPANNNTTRILLLSQFSPELKTRDIQALFADWEDDKGGLKVKWQDDESCWIVFNDPGTAKRAFLTLLSSPPPGLTPTATHSPKLAPYTGPDVPQILSAVQNRPRSRSNASSMGNGTGGHSRKGSLLGSGGGSALGHGGHGRSQSFGRNGARGSFGQKQMMEMMNEQGANVNGNGNGNGGAGNGGSALATSPPPPVPELPKEHAQGSNGTAGSPSQEKQMEDLVEE